VSVDGSVVSEIGHGFLVLLGVRSGDAPADAAYLAGKIAGLRVFADEEGRMNRSVVDVGGAVLLVSQFTLYADTRRGRRPSFVEAAAPEEAEPLVRLVAEELRGAGVEVGEGVFGASMSVELVNEGPVTIILDSPG
jgi:D-tyrosyl-tRNA(Tyr) deacylase